MADRCCENCGGAVPPRTSRQRNPEGALVCDSCISLNLPKWSAAMSYASTMGEGPEMERRMVASIASIARVRRARTAGLRIVAHDSGDNAIINHCPFCGSGGVVAKGAGTVACEFCHSNFTVQVQPAHPFMPQTVDGQPVPPAGMPGDTPTEMSAPLDPAVNETEEGVVDDEGVDPVDPTGQEPPATKPKAPVPPQFAKGSSRTAAPVSTYLCDRCGHYRTSEGCEYCTALAEEQGHRHGPTVVDQIAHGLWPWGSTAAYRTDEGHTLTEDAYMARLALAHADNRDAVLDVVRHRHVAAQHPTSDCWACKGEGTTPGTDEACPTCDGTGLVEVKIPSAEASTQAAAGDNPHERTCTNQRCLDYGARVTDDHEHYIVGDARHVHFPGGGEFSAAKRADLLNPDLGVDDNDRDLLDHSGSGTDWDADLLAPAPHVIPARVVPPWLRDEQTGGFYS